MTYLLAPLCRHDNIEVIGAVSRCDEVAGLCVVAGADVGDDAVEDDVFVLLQWPHVFAETGEKCHFLCRNSAES